MRPCNACGTVKAKAEFARKRLPTGAYTVHTRCKACLAAIMRRHRAEAGAAGRAAERARYWADPERRRAQRRASMERHMPEVVERRRREYHESTHMKARCVLYAAIKAGTVRRGDTCESCGVVGRIEAHHEDYSKPLDVQWLCSKCHGVTRRKERAA
jgi:hypothetical protein